ncbi:Cathepsin D precursor, putative [Perkinsus marinus ATCC 50983]|uniref:Cathepsin D, putative n=1 Tax=Perkinsus marinus (strain ATCC 50983 / TXsc) TaxID=423536 RepID=C5KH73_PERM5|nr:Cathepsin D precursor, putative [Perkinsus marinus ATCC 50983]EER15935.1 Cathepsin D precursor, putative [Perkinsus marinus ATCC 50983]|eukprot:XP_002784139.1 Cathepsin D precursor, putative [Perkinsus marinus ATCC 50983]
MHDICLIAVVWAYSVIGGYGQVMRMNTEYTWVPGYGPTLLGYQSLMSQLRSRVQSETFALYLRRNPRTGQTVGELLLGGGDPSLYVGPLRYAQLRDPQEFAVTLDTLQVGSGIMTIGINGAASVDTGSQALFVPPLYMDGLKKEILAQASAAARTSIRCRDIPGRDACLFDCAYRRLFPVLTLGLNRNGDIPLLINNMLYTHEIAGVCSLMVAPTPGDTWLLPDFVVVDNYFEFQPSQGRIGIAKIRPH